MEDAAIIELIKNPRFASDLKIAKEIQAKHRLHVLGDGFQKTLEAKIGFESINSYDIKREIARPATPRIFSQILKIFYKVFRAKGGVYQLRFKDDNKELLADAQAYLKDIYYGMSDWEMMQSVWFKAMSENFNGLLMVELQVEEKEQPEPSVVFVPTENIVDLCVIGNVIKYLIIRMPDKKIREKKYEVYRYIDKDEDSIFLKNGDEIIREVIDMVGEEVVYNKLKNYFGEVPAIQVSQICRSTNSYVLKTSFIAVGMNDADKYQDADNDHSVTRKLHGDPLFYSYPVTCPDCNGRGERQYKVKSPQDAIDAESNYQWSVCNTCNGNKSVPHYKRDKSKGITVPIPESMEDVLPSIPAPAGYVTPPVESFKEQREELKDIKDAIEYSILGVNGLLERKKNQQTALGQEIDLQPVMDMLSSFSANAETVHQFLVKLILRIRYGDNFVGCNIYYGRKYFLRTEQEVSHEYAEAKKDGTPAIYLRELLEELIITKFENNPVAMQRSMMLLEIEPFPTYTIKELTESQALMGLTSDRDLQFKIYFNDIIEEFERGNGNVLAFGAEKNYDEKIKELKSLLYLRLEEILKTKTTNIEGKVFDAQIELRSLVGGTTAIVEMNNSVAEGKTSREAAIQILQSMFGFTPEEASKMITTNKLPTEPIT